MSFKPEDYPNHADEHFSAQDAKNFFEALEKGDFAEIETKFQTFVSNAEKKMDSFFTAVLGSALSDEAKRQIDDARSVMKAEFGKIKTWFTQRIQEIKGQPADDAATKLKAFKEEFSNKWGDFKKLIVEKTKSVRNFVPNSSEKKPSIDAEAIVLKAQNTVNEVVLPKLKNLFALSKAAAEGALKGVKDMQKKKEDSEKK